MAELIELRKERMLPELEQMKRIQLFEDREIRDIVKERDAHAYRIQRQTKKLRDFLAFISFEKNLVSLVRERRKLKHIPQKKANIELAILNRIKILYKQTVHRFPEEISVWDEYIQFCKQYKFGTEVSAILDRMIQFHADKPETWQKAVMWEHTETKNKERVKHFILGGLQRHPKSEILYFTFFKLKLLEGAGVEEDEDKEKLIAQAELIYKNGKENVSSIEFVAGMLDIASQFEFARQLEAFILSDMRASFPKSELMWHTLAKRELSGNHLSRMEDARSPLDPEKRIELGITTYESACQILNTETMWNYYLDTLLELNAVESAAPLEFKDEIVPNAFKSALKEGKLNEEYFLKFIELASENTDLLTREEVMEVLQKATQKYPKSVALWEVQLRFHIEYDEAEELYTSFRVALKKVNDPKLTYPLWELLLLFYKSSPDGKYSRRVRELYKEAINLAIPEISNRLKPQFLEHVALTEGMVAARKEYAQLCLCVPSCWELHRQMAQLEAVQEQVDVNSWRKCHEMATQLFGRENIQAWLEFIRFERTNGDAKRVSALYQRAMNSLEKSLVGVFITEYNLKANQM